jgi:hypothetical protein
MSAATAPSQSRLPVLLILVAALAAALMSQIIHELTHAVAMWTVGNGVNTLQLFAVLPNPVADVNAQLIIAGSAAIVNIVLGGLALLFFHLPNSGRPVTLRLLVMYTAAYMLLAGFGYLMIGALFYDRQAEFFPDWMFVVHALGGGWEVRLPILLIGVIGLFGVFFWLPSAALRFIEKPLEKAPRVRGMFALTMLPYLVINLLLTLLSLSHPLGTLGVVISVFAYWFGNIGFFWAYFIGGMWMDVKKPYVDATVLAAPALPLWLIGLAGMWAVIAFLMLPGIRFGA